MRQCQQTKPSKKRGYNSAKIYAQIRVELERAGKPLDNMDMLVAATALSIGATLVINNEKRFTRIPKLKTANWR